MTAQRHRPAAVILDLLRAVGGRGHAVAFLIEAGSLFGFTENRVRVTLSRLLARGLVESPARGRYRLAGQADPVNAFVERWRDGEARRRPWRPGCWLLAHVVDEDARSRWTLEAFGLREVRAGLFARPDNLATPPAALRSLGSRMGLAPSVFLAVADATDEAGGGGPEQGGTDRVRAAVRGGVPEGWLEAWAPATLAADYGTLLHRLRESAARLDALPRDRARLESFRLGGEVIHCLAKDPLLPPELLDPAPRAALWRAMLDYDARGRRVWAAVRDDAPGTLPFPRLDTLEGRTAS